MGVHENRRGIGRMPQVQIEAMLYRISFWILRLYGVVERGRSRGIVADGMAYVLYFDDDQT